MRAPATSTARYWALTSAMAVAVPAAAEDWECSRLPDLPAEAAAACAEEDIAWWQDHLDRLLRDLPNRIGVEQVATLRAGQAAWRRYRDATCEIEGAVVGGNADGALARLECIARLTEMRTVELGLLQEVLR